jgi:peptidoglycan/xylan/chitin deacetylase (PgdA/CDA1 family)
MHHRPWRGLDDSELRDELVVSKATLEDTVGARVTDAACPFGSYDRKVLRALKGSGYARVFTSDGGAAKSKDWLQARTSVGRQASATSVDANLAAASGDSSQMVRRAKTMVKRWR